MIRQCNFKGSSGKDMDFTDLSGSFKQELKTQLKFFLSELQFKNNSAEVIINDIDSMKPIRRGVWPFGKR